MMGPAVFDLADCLQRARQQDQSAAQALVEHLYPLVIRIVRSHLPRRLAEEDLAQEVFLKLFTRLDQYRERDGTPFEHWVSRLAVRTCLDQLRAERRRPETRWADLPEEESQWLEYLLSAEPDEPAESPAAARELLEKLMVGLSPADRLVIVLLDLEQKSVREISQRTGWSRMLVKVRAFRARRKLRQLAVELKMESIYE
jgi:RNA polymerase sigma factor (sigma-70 family)